MKPFGRYVHEGLMYYRTRNGKNVIVLRVEFECGLQDLVCFLE